MVIITNNIKIKNKWVVTSAWPYVNAIPHLGNMIGSVLSADVFARYLRLKGDDVVFVSGSDTHGTPVAVAAKNQNIATEELAMKNHNIIKKLFEQWNISYDNYTHTHNPTHIKFVQDFYLDVQKMGTYLKKKLNLPIAQMINCICLIGSWKEYVLIVKMIEREEINVIIAKNC